MGDLGLFRDTCMALIPRREYTRGDLKTQDFFAAEALAIKEESRPICTARQRGDNRPETTFFLLLMGKDIIFRQ